MRDIFILTTMLVIIAEASMWDLSNTLGNNMVLQRHPISAVMWGGGINGTTVSLNFSGKTYHGIVKDSKWNITLDPMPAGSHGELLFHGDGITRTLKNVLFGDVILCSGQGNMVFSTQQMYKNKTYINQANQAKYRSIRLMTSKPEITSTDPQSNLSILQKWSEASSQTVADGDSAFSYFSAICWMAGMKLFDDLQGEVPVGLVSSASSSTGNTQVKCWSSSDADQRCCNSPSCRNSSTIGVSVCWNSHIVPLLSMQFRSVLWFQGDSDVNPSDSVMEPRRGGQYYGCAIQAMVIDWRLKLHQPGLPFIWIQLSPWTGQQATTSTWQLPAIREAQTAANLLENIGFASAVDLGDYDPSANPWGDIHFRRKSPLGSRLANTIRSVVYHQQIYYRSPEVISVAGHPHNGSFLVRFSYTQQGLHERYQPCPFPDTPIMNPCSWWTLQAINGKLYNASATIITPDAVSITPICPSARNLSMKSVSYLYSNWPVATLYNSIGLPALPFNFSFVT